MAEAAKNLLSIERVKKLRGKRYANSLSEVREKMEAPLGFEAAVDFALSLPKAKFDESLEVAFNLGVDPKQADQMIRGALVLPHGTGKSAKVVVFAKGEKETEAKEAGADEVGAEELAEKIQKGYSDFTAVVATPDMMPVVSKVARVLGPKGLMPNPKVGTVTMNIKPVIEDLKKGRVEYRVDKNGIIHCGFGKVSFGADKLKENLKSILETIVKAKPASTKGHYLLSLHISSTMGPSVRIDHNEVSAKFG